MKKSLERTKESIRMIQLSYQEGRAIYLRLNRYSLAYIAQDLKLDSCLEGEDEAELETQEILDSAIAKIRGVEPE